MDAAFDGGGNEATVGEMGRGGIGGEGTERRRRLMAVTTQLAGEEGDDGGEARVREMGSGGRG